mmetsp:Transcript_6630/g.19089  ORF Transcript_6630/g.19089 Transcript_6630/m.19089 type:complete len:336 (-) Transcript_6630:199-1206(-)
MTTPNDVLDLFSDKRFRETRLRRSFVSIDDTDLQSEMSNALPHSITETTHDGIDASSNSSLDSPAWRNRVWNNIRISPDNFRNILPLRNCSSGGKTTIGKEHEFNDDHDSDENLGVILENLVLKTPQGGKESEGTADESSSSGNFSLNSTVPPQSPSIREHDSASTLESSLSLSSETSAQSSALNSAIHPPACFTHLGALSKLEHQHEKTYNDTLDEHHEAKTVGLLRTMNRQYHPNNRPRIRWPRREQPRDGLDFSRDVLLASRQDSIHAMTDSVRHLPSSYSNERDDCDRDGHGHGHGNDDANQRRVRSSTDARDGRSAMVPKAKKCVLDLII